MTHSSDFNYTPQGQPPRRNQSISQITFHDRRGYSQRGDLREDNGSFIRYDKSPPSEKNPLRAITIWAACVSSTAWSERVNTKLLFIAFPWQLPSKNPFRFLLDTNQHPQKKVTADTTALSTKRRKLCVRVCVCVCKRAGMGVLLLLPPRGLRTSQRGTKKQV